MKKTFAIDICIDAIAQHLPENSDRKRPLIIAFNDRSCFYATPKAGFVERKLWQWFQRVLPPSISSSEKKRFIFVRLYAKAIEAQCIFLLLSNPLYFFCKRVSSFLNDVIFFNEDYKYSRLIFNFEFIRVHHFKVVSIRDRRKLSNEMPVKKKSYFSYLANSFA